MGLWMGTKTRLANERNLFPWCDSWTKSMHNLGQANGRSHSETRMLGRGETVNRRDYVVLDLPVQEMETDFRPTHMKVWLQSEEKRFLVILSGHRSNHQWGHCKLWPIIKMWDWTKFDLGSSKLQMGLRGCRRVERSYSTFKVRSGSPEEIPSSKVRSSGCTLLEQLWRDTPCPR